MDVIIEEANRMERRVIDMLYYTKLDSLREETPKIQPIVFGELAFQIEERFRVQREDVKIIVEGAETKLNGDVEQMEVLLENLVENALRYAKSTIWIKAALKSEDNQVKITVENDGAPIPELDLPQLFNPFYKGNKGKFGLGLAIVKQIAELHQGYPMITNTDNGVRFTVILPSGEKQQLPSKGRKKEKRSNRTPPQNMADQ